MCDTEFTIDQGKLWMLQTRVGKRTGAAALKMAVDMVRPSDLGISKAEAVSRITEDHLDSVLHPQFAGSGYTVWAKGLGASPGAAVGRIYFTADDAAAAAEPGREGRAGAQRDLARGRARHAGLRGHPDRPRRPGQPRRRGGPGLGQAGRGRGRGAAPLRPHAVTVGDITLHEGDWVSLDGGAGIVVAGQVPLTAASPPPAFVTVLSWADDIRKGHLAVRANADTGEDAANARSLGAEGIGLCRTEHMFLGEDRLPVVRRMILADTPADEAAALEELRQVQREDFIAILAAMDGLPVTVRLLDPPLHEFLPSTEEMAIKDATVGLSPEERRLYAAALSWKEANPMLGTRGVRLGVVKPGLYAMQVRALMEAARQRVADGGTPDRRDHDPPDGQPGRAGPGPELGRRGRGRGGGRAGAASLQGRWPRRRSRPGKLEVTIGTMIETPRAALRAGEIAEVAEFFSFGTNDLTQMTFGFSRDDVEGRMMGAYLELGLLPRNPFEVVDADGVGELVRLGTERGRATRPSLKVGVCGEHGGDPESIALFYDAGLDYVSCSPFRVPVARLAAAQAVLAAEPPRGPGPDRGPPSGSPRTVSPKQGPRRLPAGPEVGRRPQASCLAGPGRTPAQPRYRQDMAHTRRGRGPGAGGNRHRGSHRRARRAEAGRTPLDRAVPVPHREEPLVQRQRRGGLLLLLRLPGLG